VGLTLENYSKGFMIDEELMAGVTEHPEQRGLFVAFVLRHTTGEYLGYQPFEDLNEALGVINRISRPWKYDAAGGCGGCAGGTCNKEGGGCPGSCAKGQCST
jgi:hypothetical protein